MDKELTKRQKEAEAFVKELEKGLVKKKSSSKKRVSSGKKGRSKGDKNVTSLGGGMYVNKYGVEFSDSEREALRQAVNSVKRKQKRILSDTTGKYKGLKTYLTSNDGSLTGVLGKFSTSMNEYETREALEKQLERLNRMKKRGYELDLMKRTKENYIKSISPTFMYHDPEFIKHLENMSVNEFFNRRGSELVDDFVYLNSSHKDAEDIYIIRMVHSFGWLTPEERLNKETVIDRYTGEKIQPTSKKRVKKVTKK